MRKLGILLAVVLFGLMIFAEADLDSIVNRIELLEEYANMIYDAVGTKVATEDFEAYVAEMEDRIGALETELLNVKSSVETGMPAIRDMLYELSANLAAVEERLTSYVEVSIASLKEELSSLTETDWASIIEDLKVTLDIHDSDILKIYETLGTLSEQIAMLNDMLAGQEELVSNVESLMLKVDMHDQDIVNIYDNLSAKADREQVDMLEASVTELYDAVNGLNEILTGLAAQIGDTDYLLRKQISDLEKNMNAKLGDYVTKTDLETVVNRLELLEEYANMIYDTLNTKVSEEDFASAVEELNANIEKVNTDLNAKISKVSEDTNKKIEDTNKKLDTVQMLSILGIGLGAVAIILKFVNF